MRLDLLITLKNLCNSGEIFLTSLPFRFFIKHTGVALPNLNVLLQLQHSMFLFSMMQQEAIEVEKTLELESVKRNLVPNYLIHE